MKNKLGKDGHFACALCDTKILFRNHDNTLNTNKYKEVSFLIKRKSMHGFGVMTVGFCPDCKSNAKEDKKLFSSISKSVKEGWQIEFDTDNVTQELQDKYWADWRDMKIVDWYNGEKKLSN